MKKVFFVFIVSVFFVSSLILFTSANFLEDDNSTTTTTTTATTTTTKKNDKPDNDSSVLEYIDQNKPTTTTKKTTTKKPTTTNKQTTTNSNTTGVATTTTVTTTTTTTATTTTTTKAPVLYSNFDLTAVHDSETNISQSGTSINVTGKIGPNESGQYRVYFRVVAPKNYSDSELQNRSIQVNSGNKLTGSSFVLGSGTISGKPYANIDLRVNNFDGVTSDKYTVYLNWGDEVKTYTIIIKVTKKTI